VARKGGRLIWYPGQVDVSIRPGWFYHEAEDGKVKSLEHLLDIYYTSVGGNAQLLLNIPPDKRGRIHENDAQRLKELGDRLRATFAVNLAEGVKRAGLFSNYTDGISDEERRRLVFGDLMRAEYEYELGGPRTFNVAMLMEDLHRGQLVEAFALDVWGDNGWKETGRGTTIGWKKLLRFPSVTTAKVRIRVLKARGPLIIFVFPGVFGLFSDPER
jgi:alpha-L-fucosidase